MLPQQRKRGSYNTLDQKLWLIKHHEEHKKAKLAKMALDFSSQFNRPITKSAVSRILYCLRPAIGKYCWDATLYKGSEEAEAPEEIIASEVEILEERMLKITDGFDQMHIEDDIEGNEEIDYVELVEIPEIEIISEL